MSSWRPRGCCCSRREAKPSLASSWLTVTLAAELNQIDLAEPIDVVGDGDALHVENELDLVEVGFGIGRDLFGGEWWAGGVAAGRVA